MYGKILVPLDGSAFAEAALGVALTLSRNAGAAVRLVTVIEPIPAYAYDQWESAVLEWCGKYQADLMKRIEGLAGGEVTCHIATGHVADALEEEVGSWDPDLIVMATHGRGQLSRAWIGSVASSFMHTSDRPVMMIRPEDGDPPNLSAERIFTKILVPLDGSELSESILEHAVAVGSLFGASYHLARVVPVSFDVASPYVPLTVQMNHEVAEAAKGVAQEYVDRQAAALRERGLEADGVVLVDPQPGHGLLTEAEEAGCDLIAMATHARTGLKRAVLGSAADKVVRGSEVPVLLYRPES